MMPASNCNSTTVSPLVSDGIWLDKFKYQDAERMYYERMAKLRKCESEKQAQMVGMNGKVDEEEVVVTEEVEEIIIGPQEMRDEITPPLTQEEVIPTAPQPKEAKEKRNKASRKGRHRNAANQTKEKGSSATSASPSRPPSIASQIAKAREHIKNSLECVESIATVAAAGSKASVGSGEVTSRLEGLEKSNAALKSEVEDLRRVVAALQKQVQSLEVAVRPGQAAKKEAEKPAKKVEKEEDDDMDLFGSESEEEDEDAARVREQRLAEYAAKKSKKPALVAKSSIVLDVKPWDDETDMAAMEKYVRQIEADGLLWGASKLVPLAYGIFKLQIGCVIEDEKISTDWLTETIQENEDFVQSVDIAAFNKV